MAGRYLELMLTPEVRAQQERHYGRSMVVPPQVEREALPDEAVDFIGRRDSFYLATVSPTGWPYVQHRGGAPGFLRVLDRGTLAFADYRGNRQLISAGHLAAGGRVSLFLMDYPRRERLKVLGHARVAAAADDPELVARVTEPAARAGTERVFVVDVVAWDWNCAKHITPRYSKAEVEVAVAGLRERIRELETELARRGGR